MIKFLVPVLLLCSVAQAEEFHPRLFSSAVLCACAIEAKSLDHGIARTKRASTGARFTRKYALDVQLQNLEILRREIEPTRNDARADLRQLNVSAISCRDPKVNRLARCLSTINNIVEDEGACEGDEISPYLQAAQEKMAR